MIELNAYPFPPVHRLSGVQFAFALNADVPPPSPDVVPRQPSFPEHIPSPDTPPPISDPQVPGQADPIGDPGEPGEPDVPPTRPTVH